MLSNFWKKDQNFGHQSAVVINIPTKLVLFVLTSLGIWTALWAVFSRIPINVTAAGILVPSEGLMEIKAPGNGMVLFPFESHTNPSNQELVSPVDRLELIPPAWSKEAYDFQW